jgi:hypothetical protein
MQLKATPLELKGNQAALYEFAVQNVTKMEMIEASNTIKVVTTASPSTLKGTALGMQANAIQTGDDKTFITVLRATNKFGIVEQQLTLTFAAEPQQEPPLPTVSDNQTKSSISNWGPQSTAAAPSSSSAPSTTTQSPWPPTFAKCPSNCACLKPDEAASHGLTKKYSEQPCYRSPDNQQKWYCYSEQEGWCCKDTQVNQSTKAQCTQVGGYWSLNQTDAIQACQPMCWCCAGGKIGQVTQAQCAQLGGTCYATQANAIQACQPECWCCAGGKIGQVTQAQCAQLGGACYTTQTSAIQACQPMCWCCAGGKISYITQAQCAQLKGACYDSQASATERCRYRAQ